MLQLEYKIGDCLDLMREFPDNHFDLLLTDPPYGIGENTFRVNNRSKLAKTTDYGSFDWDIKVSREVIEEMVRVSKNQIIFGGNYYADWLPASSCWIVWNKDNTGCFADCELAWTSFNTAVRMYRYRWNGMIQENMAKKEKRVHPAQKPIELFKWILENYSNPGDLVLDPFLGSGTTLRACRETNRNCIGFEKNPEYEQLIKERAMLSTPYLESFA
ncbi:site-specific DNA-methyltransferase [Methanolobus sediminis]|uniref:Type II methyltransferase n=1 Tax=Methanolobus sediminis TaxID=3072978 RepID=A0AA51UIW3_9EURY|nr:site-specific DNA-methyltransferase [Methanolobus sediminis]WMW24352.1 site-specific DNA-methyltransferase [Methanolobus sediminis]